MTRLKLAIDLGTSQTNIYQFGSGVVLSEPSVVAVSDSEEGRVVKAVGIDAKKLVGKTAENTSIIFPVFEGVIVNEQICSIMLKYFLNKITALGAFKKPIEALFILPCGLEMDERNKFLKIALDSGIKFVNFIESSVCTGLGLNVPLSEDAPVFIVDMGGGVTDISALTLGGVIASVSVSLGGNNVDTAIIDLVADKLGLKIGLVSSERLKKQVASLLENDIMSAVVTGRDIESGKPKSLAISAGDIYPAVYNNYVKIIDLTEEIITRLPEEVSAEIRYSGIYLSGGQSKILGVKELFKKRLKLDINLCEEPELASILGAGRILGNKKLYDKLILK